MGPKINDSLGHVDRDIPPLRLQVTNSGRGNSTNSPVNNFSIDAYTTINSSGASL